MRPLVIYISNIYCIANDILIGTKTRKEHNIAINRIQQRCYESGFKLNPEKAKILAEELSFFGHVLIARGLKPDPKKLEGIQHLYTATHQQAGTIINPWVLHVS